MEGGELEAGLALTPRLLGIAVHVAVGERKDRSSQTVVAYRALLEGGASSVSGRGRKLPQLK